MVIGPFGVLGGITGGEQQPVALTKRQIETDRQMGEQLPAGFCPAGLDEAQMPGGHPRGQSQVELAEAAAQPPGPQQPPARRRSLADDRAADHVTTIEARPPSLHYLPGNRRPYRQRRSLGR